MNLVVETLPWLEVQEALDLLRVSDDNLDVIETLCEGIPAYVAASTGYPLEYVYQDNCNGVVKTLCKFVLQLWFNPDGTDAARLETVIESLTKTVKAMVVAETA